MRSLSLQIDELVVETEVERSVAGRLPEVLREAFGQLAEELDRTGLLGGESSAVLVVERLRVDTIPVTELLGPRGAALSKAVDGLLDEMGESGTFEM